MTQVAEPQVTYERPSRAGRGWAIFGVVVIGLGVLLWWQGGWFGPVETESEDFAVTGSIERVVVELDAGAIAVVGGDVTEISYTQTTRWTRYRPTVDRTVSETALELKGDCPFFASNCSVDLQITVPVGTTLELHTSAGSLAVARIDGDVDLETSAGDISIDAVSGAVRAETSAGSITGTDLAAENVDASTSAGSVDLSFGVPIERVEARTSAGDVTIEVPGGPYAVTTDALLGNIDVDIATDPAAAAEIIAETSAGKVVIRGR